MFQRKKTVRPSIITLTKQRIKKKIRNPEELRLYDDHDGRFNQCWIKWIFFAVVVVVVNIYICFFFLVIFFIMIHTWRRRFTSMLTTSIWISSVQMYFYHECKVYINGCCSNILHWKENYPFISFTIRGRLKTKKKKHWITESLNSIQYTLGERESKWKE